MGYLPDMQVPAKKPSTSERRHANASSASRHSQVRPSVPILDQAVFTCLQTLLEPAVLAQTYNDFISQTRERLLDCTPAMTSPDRHKLGHTIRGTAGMFGAHRLAACAAGLETDQPTAADLEKTIASLRIACTSLVKALRKEQVLL